MSKKSRIFLTITFSWSILIGAVFYFSHLKLDSILGIGIIALLYMPSPFVAAVIAERGILKSRVLIPHVRGVQLVRFFLDPVLLILLLVGLFLSLVFIFGNVLHVTIFGHLVLSTDELVQSLTALVGQDVSNNAGELPPPIVLLIGGMWSAILAGWTINALFAMGEEYGWRGLLWEELKSKGIVKANIILGVIWGLWHAPLILQGYNYPGHPLLGVVFMMVFTTGFTFVLTALRERYKSVWPSAAAHGLFNATGGLLALFTVGTSPLLVGPIGIFGAALLVVIGITLWVSGYANRKPEE